MDKLTEFEEAFCKARSQWTKPQWREVAETLAGLGPEKKKVGRPHKGITSVQKNYQALAWQVTEELERNAANGLRSTIKSIVKRLMTESLKHNQLHGEAEYGEFYDPRSSAFKPMGEHRINDMLETTYTEVRKLLAKQKSGGK